MRLALKIMPLLMLLAAAVACDNPGAAAGKYAPAVQPAAKFAYVASGTDVISVFSVGNDGGLTAVDTVTVTGTGPQCTAIHPVLKVLYVVNSSNNTVSQYSIGNDGKLTPLGSPTVATGAIPGDMKLDPSGKFAYVLNQNSNNIYQYNIDEVTGALAYSSTTNISTAHNLTSVAMESSGKYLYIAESYTNSAVYQFTINSMTGALSPMTPASIPIDNIIRIIIDPSGKHLYATDPGGNCVHQFSIGATGLLSVMTPATAGSGNLPRSMEIDPLNKFAYVINALDYSISHFTISAGGLLSNINTFSLPPDGNYRDIVVDGSGSYLYVVDNTGFIFLFNIDSSGALHASATPSIPVANYARSIALLR